MRPETVLFTLIVQKLETAAGHLTGKLTARTGVAWIERKLYIAGTEAEAAELARQFLDWRASSAQVSTGLGVDLVDFEREREWLEGLAKYAGRAKFREAQLSELKRMTNNDGEVRFYYTWMAQAVVLDRFMPGWKSLAFEQDVYLEDLLRQAVE
jgi:hypothetical protein